MGRDERLEGLERRVARLEARAGAGADAGVGLGAAGDGGAVEQVADPGTGAFWVLDGVRERHAELEGGAVVYAGHVDLGEGPVDWQITAAAGDLAAQEWGDLADAFGALGHPVRLRLLQAVATGAHASNELQGLPGFGTTGQIYHHLRVLTAAGWLRTGVRGTWSVPPERLVPLLVVLAAARR